MSESTPSDAPKRRDRRQHVIAPQAQMGTTVRLLVPVAAVSALSAIAVFLYLGRADAVLIHVADLKRFLLVAHVLYFLLVLGVLAVSSLLLTHRWAGPALVLENAIEGMRQGDFERRLKLRRSDHLQELATRLGSFREELVADKSAHDSALDDLQARLEQGDVESAHRIVANLRHGRETGASKREPVGAA